MSARPRTVRHPLGRTLRPQASQSPTRRQLNRKVRNGNGPPPRVPFGGSGSPKHGPTSRFQISGFAKQNCDSTQGGISLHFSLTSPFAVGLKLHAKVKE